MTYATERENFLVTMQAEGMAPEIARRVMRWANTRQRLAVASCNGVRGPRHMPTGTNLQTWRVACGGEYRLPLIAGSWREVTCPGCLITRVEATIRQWCDKAWGIGGCLAKVCVCHDPSVWKLSSAYPSGCSMCGCHRVPFLPVFQGDPRGACVRIQVPSGQSDHPEGGLCVPTRRY